METFHFNLVREVQADAGKMRRSCKRSLPITLPLTSPTVSIWGDTIYFNSGLNSGQPIYRFNIGSDGVAISNDGATLYWSPVGSRYLYGAPTFLLRSRAPSSEPLAQAAVMHLSQKGVSDGLESDSNGAAYGGSFDECYRHLHPRKRYSADVRARSAHPVDRHHECVRVVSVFHREPVVSRPCHAGQRRP